jgi:hypothetical protein
MFNPWLMMVPFIVIYSSIPYVLYYSRVATKPVEKNTENE